MTVRKPLSTKLRVALFERADGRCHICGRPIRVGELWDMEHIIALGLGGADDPSNLGPAHRACHAPKTAIDVGLIAKVKRIAAKHIGAFKSARPMDGSRDSPWKKPMGGGPAVRR